MSARLTRSVFGAGAVVAALLGGHLLGRPALEGAPSRGAAASFPRSLVSSGVALAQDRPPNLLEQLDAAVVEAAERVRPSVALVVVSRSVPGEAGPDGKREQLRDQVATSGVVWSADGYVVSLGRAFESADAIDVVLGESESRKAELIGTDEETGLAVLKIDASKLAAPLRPAPLGSAKKLAPGSLVIQIGNPFGLAGSVSLGNVAGLHRVVKRGQRGLADVIQITTPVNPGDPGGLLANARGEAVGIVASTYERSLMDPDTLGRLYKDLLRLGENLLQKPTQEDLRRLARSDEARFAGANGALGGQGIGFAIPIDDAKAVVERIKAGPLSERGYLGVQVVGLEAPAAGVAIFGVREGSPAEKAGLKQHDIVVKFGGQAVPSMRDFKRLVLEAPIGTPIEIEVRRGEAAMTIKAVLEKRGKAQ